MGTRQLKPTSPGSRSRKAPDFVEITTSKPHKKLTTGKRRVSGRNHKGETTIWHRGGGHKRRYREIDFRRQDKDGVPAKVATVEYDPNRTARICLLHYRDGDKRYVLHHTGMQVGDTVVSGSEADIAPGNALPLRAIPLGTTISCLELRPGKGAQMARSAGSQAVLVAKEGRYAQVRLPSGEVRRIHMDCRATIGAVGNVEHDTATLGKAGRKRWKGRRPHTRGVAMNPIDHPMGGGEGRSSGGRHPCTPWGKKTKGLKTRKNKRTDRFIVRRRNEGRRRKK